MWCLPPKQSAEFVFHMEDVLEVYRRRYDPKRPVVCVEPSGSPDMREKHSELSGALSRLEQQLAQHRGSLAHLDATMRLFDPDMLSQDTDPVPQRGQVSWSGPGECRRLIYDVLRDAPQPLATRELAKRVMAAKGIPAVDDHRTRALIQKTVLASLSRAKGMIEQTEVDGVVSWQVCQVA